jgi:threonine/homoserine/homoserine lactone efflux protein
VPTARTLALFVPTALALLVVPGPAVVYIVTRSIDRGRVAGIASTLGVATGSLVHVAAAALGLSALLLSSAVAFSVVKYAGAVYLVILGLRRLLAREEGPDGLESGDDVGMRRIYAQGVVVNVLNPKTALFFFAFLPQFVDPERASVAMQIAALGLMFVALGILSDGTYALASARTGSWLRTHPRFLRVRRFVSGGIYVGLGVAAALTGSRSDSSA